MTDPILHGFEARLRRPGEAMVVSRDRVASVEGVDRASTSELAVKKACKLEKS